MAKHAGTYDPAAKVGQPFRTPKHAAPVQVKPVQAFNDFPLFGDDLKFVQREDRFQEGA